VERGIAAFQFNSLDSILDAFHRVRPRVMAVKRPSLL
jgi:hypothetical protein